MTAEPTTPSVTSIQEWLNAGGQLSPKIMRPVLGIHTNALLQHEEWLEIDAAVLEVARQDLVGIADLIAAGLTKKLSGLGTVLSAYEQMGDLTEATVSMEGTTEAENDKLTFDTQYVPIPIIHKDFTMSLRMLLASRRMGEGLDVQQARVATRIVRDKMEDMLFNGLGVLLGGYPVYGYTTAPHRIIDTAVGDFGTAGNGYKTFVKAIELLAAKGFNGPYAAYVSTVQFGQLLNLLGTNDRNELSIILSTIPGITTVKRGTRLTDGKMVVVQMTSDVVDLAVAEDIVPVQWEQMGGMVNKFRIMAALAPRIKFDANNACGVAYISGC